MIKLLLILLNQAPENFYQGNVMFSFTSVTWNFKLTSIDIDDVALQVPSCMICVTAYRGTFKLMFSLKKKNISKDLSPSNIILAILLVIHAPASDIPFASSHYTQEEFMLMDALLTVEKPNHWLWPFDDWDRPQ